MLNDANHGVTLLRCIALFTFSCGIGCAAQRSTRPEARATTDETETGPITVTFNVGSTQDGPAATPMWLAYTLARTALLSNRPADAYNQGGDDYDLEHAGRVAMLASYRRHLEQGGTAVEFLDELVEIEEAGHLAEYVIYFFSQPGWSIPSEDLQALDHSAFAEWANANLTHHEPRLSVTTTGPSGHATPTMPGAGLPDLEALAPVNTPCSDSYVQLSSALEKWREEAKQLPHAPLAAASRPEFASLVYELRHREPYESAGIIWVPFEVSRLHLYAAFCAIDNGAFGEAIPILRDGLALSPFESQMRLELIHALISTRAFDEALSEIDLVIDATEDRCDLGNAWRKKGFILFEQGMLADAYKAYVKSLDYDPHSELAMHELAILDAEGRASGHLDEVERYVPPSTTQLTTECQRQ